MSAEDSKGRSSRPEQTVDVPVSSASAVFPTAGAPGPTGSRGSGRPPRLEQDSNAESGWVGDRYQLVRLLGKGGHGRVYEAVHVHLDRHYALKVLGSPDEERGTKGRFEREAKLLSLLNHENIVGVVDAGIDPVRGQYLVLELVSGKTLAEYLDKQVTLNTPLLISIVNQVARGLHHAHQQKIVHRDLKPENIMLSPQPDGGFLVKILDFGIAKLTEPGPEAITRSGWSLGTAAYMAPEQARGARDLDERVDVFAFGVVVYELLTGKRPFDGSSYNEILFRVVSQAHASILEHRPDLSKELAAVLDRALAKDRQARYGSVDVFASALVTALQRSPERRTLPGRKLDAFEPDAALLSTDEAPIGDAQTAYLPAPRKRWKGAGIGALVLAPLGVWWLTANPASTNVGPEASATSVPSASSNIALAGAGASATVRRETPPAPTLEQPSTASPAGERQVRTPAGVETAPSVDQQPTPPRANGTGTRRAKNKGTTAKADPPKNEVATPTATTKPVVAPPPKPPVTSSRPGYVLDSPY